jgi:hypothetical protein
MGGSGTVPGSANTVSYSRGDVEGTNDLTTWVFEDVSSGVNASHYGVGSITFNEPTAGTSVSKVGDFCKACHTNFHGAVGGVEIGGVLVGANYEEFIRHPATREINIGAVGGGHSSLTTFTGKTNQLHVMSPTGQRAGSYDGTDTGISPTCISCHKGHGNQNAFGLIFMSGTGTITEEGDGGLNIRALCKQCHIQGGSLP